LSCICSAMPLVRNSLLELFHWGCGTVRIPNSVDMPQGIILQPSHKPMQVQLMIRHFKTTLPRRWITWSIPCMIWRNYLERQKKMRSEEHTSELQSRENLVCRL